MNKEEIEHIEEIKKMLNFTTNDKETGLQMNGEVCHLLLEYINYLEQKESILDKVTEECMKQMTTYEDSILEIFPQRILNIIEGENHE